MSRPQRRVGRMGIVLGSLAALFLTALTVPIPAVPDSGRAAVRAEVADRLPGWTVNRLNRSWEGAYTVVTSCAGRQLSFQFVPGHGLPSDDAWIQPTNKFARARLSLTSDNRQYLLWRQDELSYRTVACVEQVAQGAGAGADGGLPRGVD